MLRSNVFTCRLGILASLDQADSPTRYTAQRQIHRCRHKPVTVCTARFNGPIISSAGSSVSCSEATARISPLCPKFPAPQAADLPSFAGCRRVACREIAAVLSLTKRFQEAIQVGTKHETTLAKLVLIACCHSQLSTPLHSGCSTRLPIH